MAYSDEEEDDFDDEKKYSRPIKKRSSTPVLDNFSSSLEDAVREDSQHSLDYYVNSSNLEALVRILIRSEKKNIAIVGDTGVGRETLLKALYKQVEERKIASFNNGLRIMKLNFDSLVAGTKYRGQLEERLGAIESEIRRHNNILIYVKDLYNLVARKDDTYSNLSYSGLGFIKRKQARIVATLTPEELLEISSLDISLLKQFNIINVYPPTNEETLSILGKHISRFHHFYSCYIGASLLPEIVSLSNLYLTEDAQPSRSINLLEEACATVELSRFTNPDEAVKSKQEEMEKIKNQIADTIEKKETTLKRGTGHSFEEAASLRDTEKRLVESLEKAEQEVSALKKKFRVELTKKDLNISVANITGFDINKIEKRERILHEPYEKIKTNTQGLPQYEFSQTQSILNGHEIKIKQGTAFVLIPHNEEYDQIFEHCLKPTLELHGLTVMKASDIYKPGNILSQVWNQIRTSEIIIADVSDQNLNVIFELGLCYGIQRCPILITRDPAKVPFNLRSLRFLDYSNDIAGIEQLKKRLHTAVGDFISIVRVNRSE